MGQKEILLLVLNAGSSSIKADVYKMQPLEAIFSIHVAGIGQTTATMKCGGLSTEEKTYQSLDFETALRELFAQLETTLPGQPAAIGYRVVHGGDAFQASTVINNDFLSTLSGLAEIDPEHIPITQKTIQFCRDKYKEAQHIACFDTTFFNDLPQKVKLLPIPRKFYEQGIRRYGFHGLSYTYLLGELRRISGDVADHGKVILAHLGSGVSLCAVVDGQPIDTTMAYSPASGVMMSTRSGDIDPAVYWQLLQSGLENSEVQKLLSEQSGLLGVSGISADMYTLLQQAEENDNAKLAIEMFCYQVRKVIGSYCAAMGGCDAIVFSGGMGENAPKIRAEILEDMGFLGIELDETCNQRNDIRISSETSRVAAYVIQTNESQVVASEMIRMLSAEDSKQGAV